MTESTNLHILCMEDDRGEARLFQKHLERAGYRVDLAYDGEEGLAMLDAGPYDVVIIDHLMPGCTGLEVLRTLAERGPLPPTVMVTGAGDERTAVEAMKLGADDYLVKDVGGGHLSLLTTIIERVRDKRRLVREREEALDALRESERQYRTLVETTGDIILLHDEEGRITFVNQAGLAFSGSTEQEVLGRSIADFLPPGERAGFYERRSRRLASDRDDHLYETAFVGPGYEHIPTGEIAHKRIKVSVHSTPIIEDGAYKGSLIAARDITELKKMEEQLQLQERLTALGQLASGIAHSFRNSLNTMMLYAEMDLRRPDLPPEVAGNLRVILQECHRASDLVQQILDFSSAAMIERKPVDLTALVRDLIADLRPTMPEDIEISLTCEPDAITGALTASVDPARLRQALTNLATNARDAMPQGGELRFGLSSVRLMADKAPSPGSLRLGGSAGNPEASVPPTPSPPAGGIRGGETEHWIRLTVSDTGTGMTEEVRSHLFSPFFTTKDIDQGTGLGLSQAYGIVRQHNGTIDVATELGKGTTFTIYLPGHGWRSPPRWGGTKGGPAQQRPSSRDGEGRQRTSILLVADQEQSRHVGERTLASLGYRVLIARNAREALAMCQSPRWTSRRADRVALVLVDLDTPDVKMERLARDLKNARPGIKVLAVTGDDLRDEDRHALLEAGFAGVVQRPFEPDEVARMLRQTMEP